MSEKRGGENIWIAYADMLTVLLMVFLLLAMLFQVIVATSKISGPEDAAGNRKAEAEQASAQDKSKFGVSLEKQPDKKAMSGNTDDGMQQVAVKLPLVMVDTAALQPRDGDLRINVELNRTYLTGTQQNEVREEGAIIKNIRFDNLIVPNNADDFIILRVEDTDANNRKTQ